MKRTYLPMTVALVLLILRATGHAQSQRQDSLTTLKEEYQSLSRIFDILNAGDTVYTPFFPAWSVQDRGVKLRIFSAFRNHDIPFSQDETICIIATPDQQDIADIRIGKAGFGKMYAKFILSRDLHQAILARQYEYRIEVPPGYGTE